MEGALNKVVTVAVLLLVGLFLVSSIYGTMPASETSTVSDEAITIDVGNSTSVDKTYGETYLDNETVWNSSGTQLVEGTDYEWYTGNHSVVWYSSANTTDGATANITYSFHHKSDTSRQAIGTIGSAFTLGAVAIIVLVAGVILALVGGFGTNGRGRRR